MTRHNFPHHWPAAQVLEADRSEDGWEWGVGCVTSGLKVIQLFAWCVCVFTGKRKINFHHAITTFH